MTRKETVLLRLSQVSEKEWAIIADKCRKHVKLKIKYRTLFGAHSTANLGMTAEQYYFENAVIKLYTPEEGKGWDWKFESFTLLEQIIRIIDSMISEEVRKFTTPKAEEADIIEYTSDDYRLEKIDDSISVEEELASAGQLVKVMDMVSKAIEGDDQLEMLYLYLLENKSYNEIAIEMGLESKKKLYKLVERLKEKVQKHALATSTNGSKS